MTLNVDDISRQHSHATPQRTPGPFARGGAEDIPGPHFRGDGGQPRPAGPQVVFVDLDGTLTSTDLLLEAILFAAKHHPQQAPALIKSAFRGAATLKDDLAQLFRPDASLLPYRHEIVQLLHDHKAAGRTLVLATASPRSWAEAVARHLGLFDAVLASDAQCNLKGEAKLQAIEQFCRDRGFRQFAYIGDSTADLPSWKRAAWACVAAPSKSLFRRIARQGTSPQVVNSRPSAWHDVWRLLRPHQWSKNLLLFVPMLLSHIITVGGIVSALWAFLSFSLAASGVYVVNDLLDIESDRRHPTKRRRPFAAGAVGIASGTLLALGLACSSLAIAAATLPWNFVALLVAYLAVTSLYSCWLKRLVVVDVMALAGLYSLRVAAGALATHSVLSEWILGLSMFLFMSLAFAKRYSELARLEDEHGDDSAGRGYRVEDLGIIESLGPASGYLSVLVLALYINSAAMRALYINSWALWMICPLLMYWITRVWFLAKRRQLSEDPVVFALQDGVSRLLGIGVLVLLILGSIAIC
jgi:4-hydroxybenzoate polyprenyltransferase/phosphoserine phosphatase